MRKSQMHGIFQQKLDDLTDEVARERKAIRAMAQHFPGLGECIERWETLYECGTWFSHRYGGSLNITLRDLHTFRDMELINLLAEIETYFGVEFEMRDRPEYASKVFTADKRWSDKHSSLDIEVTAKLSSESALCQKVQIGTKVEVVETPIYRLDCPESEV